MHERYSRALEALARRGRRRHLVPEAGHDFSSNDYLGLSRSAELKTAVAEALARGVPVGAGASRLLRGNDPELEALESEAARFFDAPQMLFMGGGYVANFALFSVLPQRGDLVVFDELIHASAHEGMRAGKADCVSVAHNDAAAFDAAIVKWRQGGAVGTVFIAVESLYSMDGDKAPLSDLGEVALRHDAYLLIDEAHATGVYGRHGEGLASQLGTRDSLRERLITLHTGGKALGAHGALVGAAPPLCEFLINRARGFIYATAPSPLMAAALRKSLQLLKAAPERKERLQRLVALANDEIEKRCGLKGSGSQIIPVVLGADRRAVAVAKEMQLAGFDMRAVRPPTVPDGTARLRLSITLNVDESKIRAMANELGSIIERSEA